MTTDAHRNPAPVACPADIAKVLDAHNIGCSVQFLKDGRIADARWSEDIQRCGIVIRPGHLVLVGVADPDSVEPIPFEVIWRGAAVATVISADCDRLSYDTGFPPNRGVTRTLHDLRPEDERQSIQSGQQIVVFHLADDPDSVWLVDVAVDGLPLHADRLRAEWLAHAERVMSSRTHRTGCSVAASESRLNAATEIKNRSGALPASTPNAIRTSMPSVRARIPEQRRFSLRRAGPDRRLGRREPIRANRSMAARSRSRARSTS